MNQEAEIEALRVRVAALEDRLKKCLKWCPECNGTARTVLWDHTLSMSTRQQCPICESARRLLEVR